ncbi:hypothetical protein [Nitrosopumilus sp.]|uniref:hypothetical protein n=1 Tax=Nitrosopumilus sp. TaxID=2024843 RepID=UPI00292EB9E6|nr:hypothetical protein [Nitrosopumilus sp.]
MYSIDSIDNLVVNGVPTSKIIVIPLAMACAFVSWIIFSLLSSKTLNLKKSWISVFTTFVIITIASDFSGLLLSGIVGVVVGILAYFLVIIKKIKLFSF